jgi:hypothetical protein
MAELSADIRLRPTRIGFLVKPTDMSSIRQILRLNACLWGGMYNPIIPVFKTPPKEWQDARHEFVKGYDVAKGYVRFFEPDVYVEAEEGLLEKAGLESFRKDSSFREPVTSLKDFITKEYQGVNDPTFGQSVFDIFKDIYGKERRFVMRDEHPAIATSGNSDVFAELCIGIYPRGKDAQYLSQAYEEVYKPQRVKSNAETWLKIYRDSVVTPFSVTGKYLEKQRFWHHEPIIYLFDPTKPADIIDLWNLRLEPSPVFPVPIDWFAQLGDFFKKMVEQNYRPLKGNPNGIMHRLTVEVARSISEEHAKELILPALKGAPQGSWSFKLWRNPIWHAPFNHREGPNYERMRITSAEKRGSLNIKHDDNIRTEFETLSPEFADRFSGSKSRWVNVLIPKTYGDHEITTILPYNTFDRDWPRIGMGGEQVSICQEGWAFTQDHKDWEQPVYLLRNYEAFTQWFENRGIKAELSEPGRIAKQVLNSLGGFWGLHLLDTPEAINLLNSMALSTTTRSNESDTIENEFKGRTAPVHDWFKLLSIRHQKRRLPELKVSDYTNRKVIRLGLEIECAHCSAKNWYGLDIVDYEVTCERCLKSYEFPQAELRKDNKNWKYRVVGPFAVPNFAEGSYSALLTIDALRNLPSLDKSINYSTALNLSSGKKKCEIDFALWSATESKHDTYGDPQLIIGEAKSFGSPAIKQKDINQLKIAAEMLPSAVIVISVLKDDFSDEEKVLLKEFVEWARTSENYRPRHWVILFTGVELFGEYHLENAWKQKGEPHNRFANFHSTRSFSALSNATQEIYLGLPNYYTWRDEKIKQAQKKPKQNK